jgi:hypothetical protein
VRDDPSGSAHSEVSLTDRSGSCSWHDSKDAASVTPEDCRRLDAIVGNRNSPQKHIARAQALIATAEGCGTNEIMRRSGLSKPAVWRWQETTGGSATLQADGPPFSCGSESLMQSASTGRPKPAKA